jgi:hypothetical protein
MPSGKEYGNVTNIAHGSSTASARANNVSGCSDAACSRHNVLGRFVAPRFEDEEQSRAGSGGKEKKGGCNCDHQSKNPPGNHTLYLHPGDVLGNDAPHHLDSALSAHEKGVDASTHSQPSSISNVRCL